MIAWPLYLVPIVFFLGLCVGSFVNVVVMRTLTGEDFVYGRSHCDTCRRTLAWYELVPLISYIVLRGKCRTCKAEIDIMHPVVELLTGVMFVWWLLIGFAFFQLSMQPLQTIQPLFWLTAGLILLIITAVDLRAFLIPDWAVLALFFETLLYRMILIISGIYQWGDLAWSLFGATLLLCFFLFLWWVTKKRGFGFGDVKLIFPLALLMGWPDAIVGVFLSFVLGAIAGVVLLLMGRAKLGRPIPFGPFLVIGTVLTLLWGESLLRWYLGLL